MSKRTVDIISSDQPPFLDFNSNTLLSVVLMWRKLLKTTYIPKNVAFIQIQKVATFNLDRKKINLISNKTF